MPCRLDLGEDIAVRKRSHLEIGFSVRLFLPLLTAVLREFSGLPIHFLQDVLDGREKVRFIFHALNDGTESDDVDESNKTVLEQIFAHVEHLPVERLLMPERRKLT